MRAMSVLVSGMVLCLSGGGAVAQVTESTPGWFPFVMLPTDDGAGGPADVSALSGGPADARIVVDEAAHFATESGRRVRFLGTNVTFSGAFPDKSVIPALARRLAQLGFNVVRFHHMDARDIWLPGQEALDPEKLDRLDFFIAELKRHGVYSNINLHVSRTYPGLAEMDLDRAYRYGKTLDKFHEPYIVLQEAYARDLLDRVNPYTGMKLTQDPCIAFVELNNENTLLNLTPAMAGELPAVFRDGLRASWGAWLAQRYATPRDLVAAWNRDVVPLGPEILRNGGFEGGTEPWSMEGAAPGVCDFRVTEDPAEGRVGLVTISAEGKTSWAYQLHQLGVELQEGMVYTMRFRGKADPERNVSVSLRFAEAPWTVLTGNRNVRLTPDWQEFVVVAPVRGLRDGLRLRFSLNLGDATGSVAVSDLSVRPGREVFNPGDLTKVADIELPGSAWPDSAQADFRLFLADTELAYVRRMYALLRGDLSCRSLLVDTQASYGGYRGLLRESLTGDYVDMHSYWQHPRFPNRPWDSNDWTIGNTSMVQAADGGTLARLAQYRAAGKPFSVSEYNHPAPSDYAAEMFPMLAAFASLQDWDALYQFSYLNRDTSVTERKITGYFELCHHPAQLVFAPVAALAFRRELIPPATAKTLARIPLSLLDDRLAGGFAGPGALPGEASGSRITGARYAAEFIPEGERVVLSGAAPTVPDDILIDTNGVLWDPRPERPLFRVAVPAVRMAVGKPGAERLDLGDATLQTQVSEPGFVAFAAVAADGRPLDESRSVLLVAATRAENSGMGWDAERTTVGRAWGDEPVVAEGVSFEFTLPGAVRPRAFALDPSGKKGAEIPVVGESGAWTVRGNPEARTLWYVLER